MLFFKTYVPYLWYPASCVFHAEVFQSIEIDSMLQHSHEILPRTLLFLEYPYYVLKGAIQKYLPSTYRLT
jgi:hypothetical protein